MKFIFALAALALSLCPAAGAQTIEIPDTAELQIALEKLNVLGSVLYFAAHPDDENTAALAYFSKGRKYRAAYLSLTRGDGGQNLIGPEKGAEIGILRTHELLSARRIDGAEQFFTRAVDFGYSKTAEETLKFWGKSAILSDVVWVIRRFRPDVIMTRFPVDGAGGHGHHTASGLLLKEAFRAASDPGKFPEQLAYVKPWQVKRLLWNTWRPGREEMDSLPRIDTGEYNPLLGKSYSEMAAEGRSQHKSQGFGSAGRRGTQYNYFRHVEGVPADRDVFDGIDTSWTRVPGGAPVGRKLGEIIASFKPRSPSASIPQLLDVYEDLCRLEPSLWVDLKKKEMLKVIQSCAGLWMEVLSSDFAASPGDDIDISATVINRSGLPVTLKGIHVPAAGFQADYQTPLFNNEPQTITQTVALPEKFPISQPYWLDSPSTLGMFSVESQENIGLAENPPSILMTLALDVGGHLLEYEVPLLHRWTDRVDGERYRAFEIRPKVTVSLENKVLIFTDGSPREIKAKLKSHSRGAAGQVLLQAADGWRVSPAAVPFSLTNKYEEVQVSFWITPPEEAGEAIFTAGAKIGGEILDRDMVEIVYPHIERRSYFPLCRIKAVRLDVKKEGQRLGYIMGSGDEVPDGLRSLGYEVDLLTDDMLENEDLSRFDAVIAGIRAYNTRERLSHTQDRLLEYVKNGGTLIVQYNVARGLLTDAIGPYPLTIGRDRVCEEEADVNLLHPDHPLLNFPNTISAEDFEGWVQERGLYFASQWDDKYDAVLSCRDRGETEKNGGMMYAKYGKGSFIYTGYSWFRQLPEGVPGAFRIFANMIAAGKSHGRSNR
jgi:LmbE family N-acetylglucosaminyl deacetylase